MSVIKEFWAKAGWATFPDGATVPFWGFAPSPDGEPQLPGPTIEANVGDNVQITLNNTLSEPVSIIFPGQDITPEPVKDQNNVFISFNRQAPPNGSTTYSFRAVRPGTYLYESGTFPEKQVQMGLYGSLIIRPAEYDPSENRTAYGSGTGTNFDIERIIVTGEIDSALHSRAAEGIQYDMYKFAPDYFTINGRAYPDTLKPNNISSQPYGSSVKTLAGRKVLLRCANAGFLTHTLHIGSGSFRVVAGDARALKTRQLDATYEMSNITIAPGQTYDLLYTAGLPEEVYLYDRDLRCTVNAGQFPGGIMTSIKMVLGSPAIPMDLTATATSANSVRLEWIDNSGGDNNFLIERTRGKSGIFTQIATVPAGITDFTDTQVMESTVYTYRVSGYNDFDLLPYSNASTVKTPALPPPAPSDLNARRLSDSAVLLAWTGNSKNISGYIVERRSQDEAEFSEIANIMLKIEKHINNTPSSITYNYRVRAYNSGGSSGYSNTVTV